MHSCQHCGCACYCGGDIDDSDVGDFCRIGCGCEEDDYYRDEEDPILCRCGRPSCEEACEQCGAPLCPMCHETQGGFCERHPDDSYQPPSDTHYAEGQ